MTAENGGAAAGFLSSEPPAPETLRFTFTGSGREYFRIWIVNLCLTIATLGIYSAWAKVRRLRYFDQNTHLGDAVFDFHGNPKAILKGRLLAVGMLAAYHYAFGFSRVFGIVVVGALFLALPWLMRSALRFRLSNTSHRALRFAFDGSLADAYFVYAPVMLLFLAPSAIVAWNPANVKWSGAVSLLYLAWPWMHARIKHYQHANLRYGSACADYAPQTKRFFGAYFKVSLIGFCIGIGAGIAMALQFGVFGLRTGGSFWTYLIPVLGMVMAVYVVYLFTGPYLQATLANLV